jgi:hypothetical protein
MAGSGVDKDEKECKKIEEASQTQEIRTTALQARKSARAALLAVVPIGTALSLSNVGVIPGCRDCHRAYQYNQHCDVLDHLGHPTFPLIFSRGPYEVRPDLVLTQVFWLGLPPAIPCSQCIVAR